MKFGACISNNIERIAILKELGYDYCEGGCGAISSLNDDEFDSFLAHFKEIDLPMPVANGFIPGEIKLAGPESDKDRIRQYLDKLFKRADLLGIKSVVFGSGGARKIPDSMTAEDGLKEIEWDIENIICPMAREHGITVVIEPLRIEECNIFNTVKESFECISRLKIDNLKVLADVYHMICMDEPIESLTDYKGTLVHAHTSNPVGGDKRRVYPTSGDGFSQKVFIDSLLATGVETCSVEAGSEDFYNDAKLALVSLKEALK